MIFTNLNSEIDLPLAEPFVEINFERCHILYNLEERMGICFCVVGNAVKGVVCCYCCYSRAVFDVGVILVLFMMMMLLYHVSLYRSPP